MNRKRVILKTVVPVLAVIVSIWAGSLLSIRLASREEEKKVNRERLESCRNAVRVERTLMLADIDQRIRKSKDEIQDQKGLIDQNTAGMKALVDAASRDVADARKELRTFRNVAPSEYAETLRRAVAKLEVRQNELEKHQRDGEAGLRKLQEGIEDMEKKRDAMIDGWQAHPIDAEATNRMILVWGGPP